MEAVGISHENIQTKMATYRHANDIYEDSNITCMSEGHSNIPHPNISLALFAAHLKLIPDVFWRADERIVSTSLKGKEQANQSKHILSDHPLIKYFRRDKRDRFQDGSAPQEKQVCEWFDEDEM